MMGHSHIEHPNSFYLISIKEMLVWANILAASLSVQVGGYIMPKLLSRDLICFLLLEHQDQHIHLL